MEIVTGYAGKAHITAEDWAELNRGIMGADSCVLQTGRAFESELVSNNLLKIYDGCGLMQGRQFVIPAGKSDEITIDNGTQGEKRIDLVVARYSKNEDAKIEAIDIVLIKGAPAATDPAVPAYTNGDIRAGDLTADMPLYEIELDGINVTEVRKVFKICMTNVDLSNSIGRLSANAIVEEGKNSNGYYRKWNNGTLEMWGSQSITRATVNQGAGGVYHSDNYTFSLPYTSLTNVSGVSLLFRSNAGVWAAQSTGGDLKKTLGYWVFGGANTTVSGSLNFRCTGTWK